MRIELRDVHKRFGKVPALSGLNLDLPSGRRVALIGPNGSGKSTLIHLLCGMMNCDQGQVLLDGHPIPDRAEAVRDRVAYVPQSPPQMLATVGEVVETVCALRAISPMRVLELAAEFDLDLRAIHQVSTKDLSGGMKQKLILSFALASDAELLLLDEPTASLDARAREVFLHMQDRVSAGATLVLCSHRLEELQSMVDHVAALEGGQLAFSGSIEAFLATRSMSVVEVSTDDLECGRWLAEHGFRPGFRGSWAKAVHREDKVILLAELLETQASLIGNLVVRDSESIESDLSRGMTS